MVVRVTRLFCVIRYYIGDDVAVRAWVVSNNPVRMKWGEVRITSCS